MLVLKILQYVIWRRPLRSTERNSNLGKNYLVFFCFFFILCSFNYRGSTSDTAESLYSLPGKVGAQGVQDVKKVTDLSLDNCNDKCDREKIFLCGDSHGDLCQLVLLDNFQMIL